MSVKITVAVCTYNRAALLQRALVSLGEQAVSANRFEILVVDNGSTDNTNEIVQSCQQRYPQHNIRFSYEGKPGLGRARTVAMRESKGSYIAYLDDDALAAPDWIAQALAILKNQDGDIACLGGPIYPYYLTPKPSWFKDEYETHTWGDQSRKLEFNESFNGSNMIWRKESLQAIGGFSSDLGVTGDLLSGGEETDAFRQYWRQFEDPHFYYQPSLRVRHLVPEFKMRVVYQLKRAFVVGQVGVQLIKQSGWQWRAVAVLGGTRFLLVSCMQAVQHVRRYKRWQNWLIEEGAPIMRKIGTMLASLDIFVEVKQR